VLPENKIVARLWPQTRYAQLCGKQSDNNVFVDSGNIRWDHCECQGFNGRCYSTNRVLARQVRAQLL